MPINLPDGGDPTREPGGSPKAAFSSLGKNFMTPEVLGYRWTFLDGRWWAAEISEGTDFDRNPIFGVTFRDPDNPDEAELDLSGMFRSKPEALRHYQGILE